MKDHFVCEIACLLVGMIVGVTAGIIPMMGRARPSREWVVDARRQVAAVDAMTPQQRARWREATLSRQELRERWGVIEALAGVRFAGED